MITEDYVSFETAKLLKEKGFDETTQKWYLKYKGKYSLVSKGSAEHPDDSIDVPTLQMAMKWLREVHNIFIRIIQSHVEYCICEIYYDKVRHYQFRESFNSYEEACEAAIKYVLENLI